MRTFASLLKGGFVPKNGDLLWKINQQRPYLEFCKFIYGKKGKQPLLLPRDKDYNPKLLYIHPYFPDLPISAVKIVKSFPYAKIDYIYSLNKGVLTLAENITFTEEQIYLYPTFFKPIYKEYNREFTTSDEWFDF